jgi:hypothetical protein
MIAKYRIKDFIKKYITPKIGKSFGPWTAPTTQEQRGE